MSTAELDLATPASSARRSLVSNKRNRLFLAVMVVFTALSFTRWVTDSSDLTASNTMGTVIRVTVPLLLAGLATLWAERCGVLNIGIEGLMIFGTWFGAWAAWEWGAWYGFLLGAAAGALASLLHAMATVRFNVNHVISGTAINIMAFGGMRYLSELVYTPETGGGISQSPNQSSSIPTVNLPVLGGGEIFGWRSPDVLGWLEKKEWFLVSDIGGVLGGFAKGISWASLIAFALVPTTAWILWKTRFGLRLRSSGEDPHAAESLGVNVLRYRYIGLAVSGALAGLAGAFLSIVSSSAYQQGQTAGRGFIGIATAIFGNWTPTGVLSGAALFGFFEALQLVGQDSLPNIFLFAFFLSLLVAVMLAGRRQLVPLRNALGAGGLVMVAWLIVQQRRDRIDGIDLASGTSYVVFTVLVALLAWIVALHRRDLISLAAALVGCALLIFLWLTVTDVPEPLTKAAPYVVTLIVLSFASQRLRPPAMAGAPYRPGDNH